MNKYFLTIIVCMAILAASITSCKKTTDNSGERNQDDADVITDEYLNFFSSLSDTSINLSSVKFFDSVSVLDYLEATDQDFLTNFPNILNEVKTIQKSTTTSLDITTPISTSSLRRLLTRVDTAARYLCKRSNFISATGQPNGLAYVYGGTQIKSKSHPSKLNGSGCLADYLYGLDCNGFVYQVFLAAGLDLVKGFGNDFSTTRLGNLDLWNKTLKASSQFSSLKIIEVTDGTLKDGDIILWKGHHVGIFMKGSLFNSQGSNLYPRCDSNAFPNRGPRLQVIVGGALNAFGKQRTTLRFVPDVASGAITYSVISYHRHYHDSNNTKQDDSAFDGQCILTLYENTDIAGFFDQSEKTYEGTYSGNTVNLSMLNVADGFRPLSSLIVFSTTSSDLSFTAAINYFYPFTQTTYDDEFSYVLKKIN